MTHSDDIQRLADIEAIKQLKARYFRLMDTKQWDDWARVFTADVVMEVPEVDMVNNGRDEVVQVVSSALAAAISTHHGHMPEIEITGHDTARGIWAMFDIVEWPSREDDSRVGLMGFGHYIEEYRREGGEWRIARTRLERLRVDPL